MTTKEQAEKLAMRASGEINRIAGDDDTLMTDGKLSQILLSTIPIVELLECVEALRKTECYCFKILGTCPRCDALTNLSTKLNEKGQP